MRLILGYPCEFTLVIDGIGITKTRFSTIYHIISLLSMLPVNTQLFTNAPSYETYSVQYPHMTAFRKKHCQLYIVACKYGPFLFHSNSIWYLLMLGNVLNLCGVYMTNCICTINHIERYAESTIKHSDSTLYQHNAKLSMCVDYV